jgi:hypothetical protein
MAMEMMALRTTGGSSKVDGDYAAEEGNDYYVKGNGEVWRYVRHGCE